MPKDEPCCIIRPQDGSSEHSPTMPCQRAFQEAQSGRWGAAGVIEEACYLSDEVPHVLRKIAIYSATNGIQIIEEDKAFQAFLENNQLTMQESAAIRMFRAQMAETSPDNELEALLDKSPKGSFQPNVDDTDWLNARSVGKEI